MNNTAEAHLFALVVAPGATPTARHIPISAAVQQDLAPELTSQADELLAPDYERVPFDGRLTADDAQVLVIENYLPPQIIQPALGDPFSLPSLRLPLTTGERLRGLFATLTTRPQPYIVFQNFDQRRLLTTKGISLIFSADTFRRLEDPGLVLDNHATAVLSQGALFFRSFTAVQRLLDLTAYFREATDQDIHSFCTHHRIAIHDPAAFIAVADSWIRRKLTLIQATHLLEQCTPRRLQTVAHSYGLALDLTRKNGKEQLLLPSTKRELKALLRFLDDDYFTSTLSDTQYVTNSKRVNKRTSS
jgi:Domain of unknown function (DUF4868)